jgi:hypothetical protein
MIIIGNLKAGSKRANFMTKSMIPHTNWKGIGKGIGFMARPGHPKDISKELPLLDSGQNDRSFRDYDRRYRQLLK